MWGFVQSAAVDFASKASVAATEMGKQAAERADDLRKKAEVTATDLTTAVKSVDLKAAVQKVDIDHLQRVMANGAIPPMPSEDVIENLDFTYISDNVIAMGFPSSKPSSTLNPNTNPIDAVAGILQNRHRDHFMVWNLSEEAYDYKKFSEQVLEFKFPGHPAPPLGTLFRMCTSMEAWTDADPGNVAAVHCLTGKGRTCTLLACYLAWIGHPNEHAPAPPPTSPPPPPPAAVVTPAPPPPPRRLPVLRWMRCCYWPRGKGLTLTDSRFRLSADTCSTLAM